MNACERFLKALDIEYAYNLAKKMEQYRSNPVLGYRTAGSEAERLTGDMLYTEMKNIGLCEVCKDPIHVDAWEFKRAVLTYEDALGNCRKMQLGAYQTTLVTEGSQLMQLVYCGKGTAKDYEGQDVQGKLVLVDMNQRDEWWINFPVYQAHLKGAKALIAVQEGGYGEFDEEALNAQDIAGPDDAPAFSISRRDAAVLKAALKDNSEITVYLDASTQVIKDAMTYNIAGKIPGKNNDRMILLSAHYDSYFDGFQDDNTAVAMFMGIAKAILVSGYEPENTLVFCAMAAEEWGISNSKYDWSTGAYEEVFHVHPEWRTKVIANLNFELPAMAHGLRDAIRSTYEYEDFLNHFIQKFPDLISAEGYRVEDIYPEGVGVLTPIETWSDDFSIAISGIPSLVNDFSGGSFMATHYHSQFDNHTFYNEVAYRFHHQLYGLLVMEFDRLNIAPLNFENVFSHAAQCLDLTLCEQLEADGQGLMETLERGAGVAREVYRDIVKINNGGKYRGADANGEGQIDDGCLAEAEKMLLDIFKKEQDAFVRLDWQDTVLFPHEAVQANLRHYHEALEFLQAGDPGQALNALYAVDNNQYAFCFDEAVYNYFTEYVLYNDQQRLKWGSGRIIHHENLYHIVESLLEKQTRKTTDGCTRELQQLKRVYQRQCEAYRDDIRYMKKSVLEMTAMLENIKIIIKDLIR